MQEIQETGNKMLQLLINKIAHYYLSIYITIKIEFCISIASIYIFYSKISKEFALLKICPQQLSRSCQRKNLVNKIYQIIYIK